jgi:cell division protein ZapA (FtsZ GTPase activity inhibitor)
VASSNSNTKGIFEVNIAGQPLKLRSSRDPEAVRSLVELVNKKIQEALQSTKSGSLQTATILAALNLAEEFLELKTIALKELSQFEKKAQKVLGDLESSKVPRMGVEN